ncbi:proline--tRNA ligase [Candidatus Gottesmanbacteria bacterium RBG_16_52_11]|uniref:Proline--tRNA ligase n=1 Tax=Candidatus Gottesmanbacteria bacterium RBG_16_52_11 TaxID=1798374 RepID=A0A1F5YPS9_9BACT|nr:MAG: proline--tRNA ligase [Candidatus Gottesmanbacteria bacterium RBG_16_52_11]
MKLSGLPVKTNKNVRQFESKNATLLQKAGFIDQTMAGVYAFLPLGWRVLTKIEQIVREEMDRIGVEVFMPAIVPTKLWETTGRLETVDVLMKAVPANASAALKNDAEYVLSSTHEEVVTPLVMKFNRSYRDFPFAVYQIQTKFRSEPRAKSGLLRCREFRMKDLYSFHVSEADLKKYYEIVKKAYLEVFRRLGLGDDTVVVLASGGDFTKDYSHEFQTRCDTGEDTVFRVPSSEVAFNREVAPAKAPPVTYRDTDMLPRKDVEGKGIIGVDELARFLKIPVEKTTKTLIFKADDGQIIVAAVRGGYDVSEVKLAKAAGVKSLRLTDPETVKQITGAQTGYAGILNLPDTVRVFIDESVGNRRNFETGANRTDFHSTNVNFGRDLPEPGRFYDIKVARPGDLFPDTGEPYEVFQACEVGNIFPLNTKFSTAFGYLFTDESGSTHPVYMGSYGIGTSRVMGVIVEKFSDDRGLVWPRAVAPFAAHLITLKGAEKRGAQVYRELTDSGIEILWDDREESAGVKFSDADLLGIPYRLVVSPKTGELVEIKLRTSSASELLSLGAVIKTIKADKE